MTDAVSIPTHDSLMNPLIQALRELGGSASIKELNSKVVEIAGLTDEQMEVAHGNHRSEVEYRLAWTRTYLKAYGLIDNSTRGVWSLTPKGKEAGRVDPREVVRYVAALSKKRARLLSIALLHPRWPLVWEQKPSYLGRSNFLTPF